MQVDIAATIMLILAIAFLLFLGCAFLYFVIYRTYKRGKDANKRWEERQAKKRERKGRKRK